MNENPAMQSSRQRAVTELKSYQDLKRQICRDEGGPEDCMPILTVVFADGAVGMAGLAAGHPVDYIVMAVKALCHELEPAHGRVAHVALANEGYMRVVACDGTSFDPADFPRGTLEREFLNEPATEVREALITTVVSPAAGTVALTTSMYAYDDDGQPVFEEPHVDQGVLGGELGGAIIDEMARAVQ